ncbi:MAG TPA: hypothetical protein VGK36_04160, partial [Candidatus Angelobacter sp.]
AAQGRAFENVLYAALKGRSFTNMTLKRHAQRLKARFNAAVRARTVGLLVGRREGPFRAVA